MGASRGWRPNSKKQEDFLSLPDTVFEAVFGGAAGAGKTELLIALPIIRKFHEHPRYNAIYFRKTYKQIEESLEPRAKALYKHVGASYNAQSKLFTFPSGANIRLSYLETLDDARAHDTNEYNNIFWEEVTHFPWDVYAYLISRCRSSIPGLPAFMRAAATPGNIGHQWVYDRFIKPDENGYKLLTERFISPLDGKEATRKRIFIPARGTENPDLVKNNPEYWNNLMILPEAERRAKIFGDWHAYIGQVFKEFRKTKLPGEPDRALHVIQPFDIPSWWPKVIAIDWGFAHNTFVIWAAISPEGRIYVYREYVVNQKKISEWASEIYQLSQWDENIVDIVIDPSAQQQRGFEFSLYEQFINVTGWNTTRLADNDRIGGKQLVHEFLRWEEKPPKYIPPEGFDPDRAAAILRNIGEEGYRNYLNIFKPQEPETNIPRLQIFNTCPNLISVIPQCAYDEKKKEDVKKWDGDDGYDALRYLLKAVDYNLGPAKTEYAKQQIFAEIIREASGRPLDAETWTRFYRRMEYMEAQNKPIGAVRRSPHYFGAGEGMAN